MCRQCDDVASGGPVEKIVSLVLHSSVCDISCRTDFLFCCEHFESAVFYSSMNCWGPPLHFTKLLSVLVFVLLCTLWINASALCRQCLCWSAWQELWEISYHCCWLYYGTVGI